MAIVRIGTGFGAFVTAGATLQIEHQQILPLEEPLLHEIAEPIFY